MCVRGAHIFRDFLRGVRPGGGERQVSGSLINYLFVYIIQELGRWLFRIAGALVAEQHLRRKNHPEGRTRLR